MSGYLLIIDRAKDIAQDVILVLLQRGVDTEDLYDQEDEVYLDLISTQWSLDPYGAACRLFKSVSKTVNLEPVFYPPAGIELSHWLFVHRKANAVTGTSAAARARLQINKDYVYNCFRLSVFDAIKLRLATNDESKDQAFVNWR